MNRRGGYYLRTLERAGGDSRQLAAVDLDGRIVEMTHDTATKAGTLFRGGEQLRVVSCWRGRLNLESLDGKRTIRRVDTFSVRLVPAYRKEADCKYCSARTVTVVDRLVDGAMDSTLRCGHCGMSIHCDTRSV